MPDAANESNDSDPNVPRQPRPDDLRTLRLGRQPFRAAPESSPQPTEDAPDPFELAPRSDSGPDWVEPGDRSRGVSEPGWVEPHDNTNRTLERQLRDIEQSEYPPADQSERPPWQRFQPFGGDSYTTAPVVGKPPHHLKRIIAYFIDALILAAVLSLIFPPLLGRPFIDVEGIRAFVEANTSTAETEQPAELPTPTSIGPNDGIDLRFVRLNSALALNLVVYVLYHGVLLGLTGATVGKRLMGIFVAGADGQPLGVPRGALRSLGLFITVTVTIVLFSLILILIHPQRRAVHDLISGSYPLEHANPDDLQTET